MYEELLIGDNVKPTIHGKIMKAEETFMSWEELEKVIRNLEIAAAKGDASNVVGILAGAVEGFEHKIH